MIDLPAHGYASYQLFKVDPGGSVEGALGGPSEFVERPGLRYGITFTLPMLTSDAARIFQSMLEQGARDDVSYPWPLDFKVKPGAVGVPLIDGASGTGAVIPVRGLTPNYQFKQGQPVAVISAGVGFIHKVTEPTAADAAGDVVLPVFPLTRKAFLDGDEVEVGEPRIRGRLSWDGAEQPAFGRRGFQFSITEKR